MKKTTLLLCLALLLCLTLVAPAAAFTGSGAGTAGDPYIIVTPTDLQDIQSNLSAYYQLGNDVDMTGITWTSIGSGVAPFIGSLNGDGFTISNLYYVGSNYPSLLGVVSATNINNLGLLNINISNNASGVVSAGAGGIIHSIVGTGNVNVSNCYVTGVINGGTVAYDAYAGGIIGSHGNGITATINVTNCWVNVTCTGTSSQRPISSAGIVGGKYTLATCNITNCYTLGSTTASGPSFSGVNGGSGGIIGARTDVTATSIIVNNCVALQTVVTNNLLVNSICGVASTSTNNYANSSMILNGTVSGSAGTAVTSENWSTQSWWETYPGWSFTYDSPWYWNTITNLPNLRIFDKIPHTSQLTATPPLAYLPSEVQLNATITGVGIITYTWQHSADGISYTNLSTGTTYIETGQTTISYTTTPSLAGTHYYRLLLTNEQNQTSTSITVTIQRLQIYTPDTILKQSSPDISTESTDQYHVQTQYILPGSPNKLLYIDQYIAYLATGNAVYKIQSDTNTITSVSSTTGNTIQNAYLGTTNAVITDTDNTTALYDYASGTQTYLSGTNTGIIASTANYAAVKNNSGYLNLYHAANGTYINATSTTVTQIAANDQTNIIIGHVGTTTLYIWKPSATTLTQTTTTLAYAITDIKQIPGTNQFLITTTSKSYILAITETGAVTTTVTSTATTALQHTQSTTTDTFIGTNTNGLYIIDNTGTTIGTYTAGATLNDASIARLTGLWAVTGGDDTQAYFLTKSGTSSWTLGQTAQIMNPVSHTQMSSTGTYALICTGTSLYLFKNTQVSTTLYYLSGIVISSAGIPWQNQTLTMNGETIVTDSSGKFVQLVTPGTIYTFVADTTTTQYTATNSQLQTIAIQLKPNPYATAITYTAAYNATSGNIEMAYGDTTGKTESVTWSIYDTSNKTTVYTHTGDVGTETYAVPLEDSYKNYQVTVTADRGDTSVKNSWTLTPSGSSPINLFGLDDTGKNIIFCAVLMIFGGLFGVLHSTKGALAVTALAAWMRYMELITVPWILISIAAVVAILASLQRGGEGKS
jgi:hypothetical protein